MSREEFLYARKPGAFQRFFSPAGKFSKKALLICAVICATFLGILVPTGYASAFGESCNSLSAYGRPLTATDSGILKYMSLNGTGDTPDAAYSIAGSKYSWYTPEGSDNFGKRDSVTTYTPPETDSDDAVKPDGDCRKFWDNFGTSFGTGFNNFLLSVNNFTYQITAWTFQNAYSNNLSSSILDVISEPIKTLRTNLYMSAIALTMLIVGIWIIFKAMKMSFREGLGGAAWALGMVILMSMFIFNPTAIPDASSKITSTFNSAILNVSSSSNEIGYCSGADYEETDQQEGADTSPNKDAVAKGTCAMWSTFVFSPWSYGQFGKQPSDLQKLNGKDVPDDRDIVTGGGTKNWALYQFAVQTKTASDPEKSDTTQMNAFGNIVNAIYSGSDVDRDLWSGDNASSQLISTLVGGISVIIGAWLIGGISIKVLIYGIMVPMMMFLLPFVGLVAPHPTFGRRMVIRYFGQVAGFVIKQIVLTVVMMLVLILFMNVSTMNSSGKISWWYSIFMIAIFAFAVNKITDFLDSVTNIGGGGNPVTEYEKRGSDQAKRLGMAGVAGLVGGVVGGRSASPMSRRGRSAIKSNTDSYLAAKGFGSDGHKIKTKEDLEMEKEGEKNRKEDFQRDLIKEGLNMDEKTGLITDKYGNIDKRNWVDDGKGNLLPPNSDEAKKIEEAREKKRREKEQAEAENRVKKARRKAIRHQLKVSGSAARSEAGSAAYSTYLMSSRIPAGFRTMARHTQNPVAAGRIVSRDTSRQADRSEGRRAKSAVRGTGNKTAASSTPTPAGKRRTPPKPPISTENGSSQSRHVPTSTTGKPPEPPRDTHRSKRSAPTPVPTPAPAESPKKKPAPTPPQPQPKSPVDTGEGRRRRRNRPQTPSWE